MSSFRVGAPLLLLLLSTAATGAGPGPAAVPGVFASRNEGEPPRPAEGTEWARKHDAAVEAYLASKHEEARKLAAAALLEAEAIKDEAVARECRWETLMLMSSISSSQRKWTEAEDHLKQALALVEKLEAAPGRKTLRTLNSLARLHSIQKKHADAEADAKRAVEVAEKSAGRDSLVAADALRTLGEIYGWSERPGEAEPLLKRALDLQRQAGATSPGTRRAMEALCRFYRVERRYDEAEPLAKSLLRIEERAEGKVSPAAAEAMETLAGIWISLERIDSAERILRRAVSAWERTDDLRNPEAGHALGSLGYVLWSQAKYADAAKVFDRAVAARDPHGRNYYLRGLCHFYAGDFKKALADFREYRDLSLKGEGEDDAKSARYAAAWAFLAASRAGEDAGAELAAFDAKLKDRKWLTPVLEMFLGKLTPEQCLAAAADKDARRQREQQCEAHFFSAQLLLLKKDPDAARKHLENCRALDVKYFIEHKAAKLDLDRLAPEAKAP